MTGAPTAPQATVTPETPSEPLRNGEKALDLGHLFRPVEDSAFYWAKQAEQIGDRGAPTLQKRILDTAMRQLQVYRDTGNLEDALVIAGQMVEAYPDRSDLVGL